MSFCDNPHKCERCGSTDVRSDEVWHDGPLAIGECLRCALRWTRPLRRAAQRARVALPPAAAPISPAQSKTIAA